MDKGGPWRKTVFQKGERALQRKIRKGRNQPPTKKGQIQHTKRRKQDTAITSLGGEQEGITAKGELEGGSNFHRKNWGHPQPHHVGKGQRPKRKGRAGEGPNAKIKRGFFGKKTETGPGYGGMDLRGEREKLIQQSLEYARKGLRRNLKKRELEEKG